MRYIQNYNSAIDQYVIVPVRRIRGVTMQRDGEKYSVTIYNDEPSMNPIKLVDKSEDEAKSLYFNIQNMIAAEA